MEIFTRLPSVQLFSFELKSSRPLTDIYNRLGFSFGTIGNHEFNYGLSYLKDTIQRLDYPILCANIFENGKPFTGQGITYLYQNDVTIGVIGLTTQFIPHWEQPEYIKSLTFESAVETLKSIYQNYESIVISLL